MDTIENGLPATHVAVEIQKARPALRAGRAILIIVVFFLVQMAIGVVVAIGAGAFMAITQGAKGSEISLVMAKAIRQSIIPAAIAGEVVGAWVAFWMTRRILKGPIEGGALMPVGWKKAGAFDSAIAAITGCALALIYVFGLVKVSPPSQGQHWGPVVAATRGGGWPLHLWAILATTLAPPIEEFLFRGVLLEGLSNSFGVLAASVIVTAAFVLAHASDTLSYWPAWVAIALAGSASLFFRLKTRSLVPAICTHAAYNLALAAIAYTRICPS